MSLKWKLMIPFLLLAFIGTSTLTFIGLTSQQNLIEQGEKKEIRHYYHHFLNRLNQKKIEALSLATMIAEIPEVQKLLAERDRAALNDLLVNTFIRLKTDFNIEQFHFHIPPATSFLRLHSPDKFGEDMRIYRQTIMDAGRRYRSVSGLEEGQTGLGLRGVAPVFHDGEMVGTVEIGHAFGQAFLKQLHGTWGVDWALFQLTGSETYRLLARAGKKERVFYAETRQKHARIKEPTILIAPRNYAERAVVLSPVKDYSGKVVAILEINTDRSAIQEKLLQTRNLMFAVGFVGIALSFLLTYLVVDLFLRPIKSIVKEAQDIALERRESRLESRPANEIGTLTQALNIMLDALKSRRKAIEEHARTLEGRVRQRTSDLVASEEKYRTLVENVPLIVYRVLPDGTTEFINSYLTERLGYTIEEAVGDRLFWREKMLAGDEQADDDFFDICFQKGKECRAERLVKHKSGRPLTFIDHAIPTKDETGIVQWVDGIMVDISELKKLQERALASEEIRILGEISARVAHEIRNPLVTTGGFARRLRDALPENNPHRKLAQIIVDEVSRLEGFLKILLSSIKPFDLSLGKVDLNHLLESWVHELDRLLKAKGIEVVKELTPDIPVIQADNDKLTQAFESILKHAIVSMPEGEKLLLGTSLVDEQVVVTLEHPYSNLREEELEQFFFPHTGNDQKLSILDLPLSKIIIHRHGGKIDLFQKKPDILAMRIEFPTTVTTDEWGVV
ncbi:cache domain-containing protein [Thermodesulfobacteriota bacterium]